MKKFLKICSSLILAAVLSLACVLSACSSNGKNNHEHVYTHEWQSDAVSHWKLCDICETEGLKAEHEFEGKTCKICNYTKPAGTLSTDNYDTYYEIFVYSYNDSNGDSIGDLKGITQKLDYIEDMGYTGIWLTPIHPSHSENHKYSVDDYYAVDKSFGTLDDFDQLVEEAHSRGIKIILDMVFNHTSQYNAWFQQGLSAFKTGNTSNKYYNYYNFSTKSENSGYKRYDNGVYAEALFDKNMVDLNLDCEDVKEELSNVMKFWLVDHNADGFRLDAAKHYFGPSSSPDHQKSAEFVGWITETAKTHKPGAYVVSEVWEGASVIRAYYNTSKSDSFFYFPTSVGGANEILHMVSSSFNNRAESASGMFYDSMTSAIENAAGHIPAPFLDNHDTNRIADGLGRNSDKIKFAYGLISMYTGTTFTYYGDEIGMIGTRTASNTDAERRYAMLWDNEKGHLPTIKVDHYPNTYVFDGVVQQLKSATSILNYYKACNSARKLFPALVRGTPEKISENDGVLVFKKTYQDKAVTIAINFAGSQKSVAVPGATLQKGICVTGSISANGDVLTMPEYSIAILS